MVYHLGTDIITEQESMLLLDVEEFSPVVWIIAVLVIVIVIHVLVGFLLFAYWRQRRIGKSGMSFSSLYLSYLIAANFFPFFILTSSLAFLFWRKGVFFVATYRLQSILYCILSRFNKLHKTHKQNDRCYMQPYLYLNIHISNIHISKQENFRLSKCMLGYSYYQLFIFCDDYEGNSLKETRTFIRIS